MSYEAFVTRSVIMAVWWLLPVIACFLVLMSAIPFLLFSVAVACGD